MKNGEIEQNEQNNEPKFDINSIQISSKAGRTTASSTNITQLSIPMSKIISMGLTDRRKAYANNKLSFQSACIGEKATYSLDSAHKGGAFFRSKDGIVFRFGQKGQIAVQEFIEQVPIKMETSAPAPEGE